MIITRFLTIAVILVTITITFWLVTNTHIDKQFISHPWWIIASVVFALIQKLLSPAIIISVFKSIDQKCRYWLMLWITMFSTAANASVPFPAGIPIRLVLQQKILHIPYSASTSALAIEMLLTYGSMIIFCLFTAILGYVPNFSKQLFVLKYSYFLGFIIVGFIIANVFYLILKRYANGWIKWIHHTLKQMRDAKPKWIIFSIVVIHISMVLSLIRIELLIGSVGSYVPAIPLLVFIIISYLAGVISFIPMGLGVRDVSLGALLVLSGVSVPAAAVVTALDRLIVSIIYLSGSAIASYRLGHHLSP